MPDSTTRPLQSVKALSVPSADKRDLVPGLSTPCTQPQRPSSSQLCKERVFSEWWLVALKPRLPGAAMEGLPR